MTNYLEIGLLSTYVLNVWKFRHFLEIFGDYDTRSHLLSYT